MTRSVSGTCAGDDELARLRRRRWSITMLGGEIEAAEAERRIDAALEAIARVGDDAELAAGLRDVQRVPERGFDQHIGGALVDSPNARRP